MQNILLLTCSYSAYESIYLSMVCKCVSNSVCIPIGSNVPRKVLEEVLPYKPEVLGTQVWLYWHGYTGMVILVRYSGMVVLVWLYWYGSRFMQSLKFG